MDVKVKDMHVPRDDSSVLAICDLELDGQVLVKGVRVMARRNEDKDSLFVAWPMRRGAQGTWHPIAFPITEESKQRVIDLVLDEYAQMLIDRVERVVKASAVVHETKAAVERGR